jgi:hypothetical protein
MEESECEPPPSATRVGVPRPSWVRVWHVGPTGGERGEGARVYAVARPVPARMRMKLRRPPGNEHDRSQKLLDAALPTDHDWPPLPGAPLVVTADAVAPSWR